VLSSPHYRQRLQDDFEVQQQRPVFDVVQIHSHHLVKSQTVAPGNLPQPSDAWFHVEPLAMPQLVAFDFVRDGRAWADDAHADTLLLIKDGATRIQLNKQSNQ